MLASCAARSHAEPPRLGRLDDAALARFLAEVQRLPSFGARVTAISARLRGTPYSLDPLGEGPAGRYDRDPIFRLDRLDCLTFVEEVLALAGSTTRTGAVRRLQRLRYTNGEIRWSRRRHMTELQWLPELARDGVLRDVTRLVGGEATREAVRVVAAEHYDGPFARFRERLGERLPTGELRLAYLPPRELAARASRLPSVGLLALVRATPTRWPIVVTHVGLLLRDDGGEPIFRHATHAPGRVVDERLADYLARHAEDPKTLGFHVVELRPTGFQL